MRVARYDPGDATPAGPFRLSTAAIAPGGEVEVRHQLLDRPNLTESGWTVKVPTELPAGSRQLAVEVEDLGHQIWGSVLLDLPAH